MESKKLKEHKTVKQLKEMFDQVKVKKVNLIGGAVIDILDGREPKDYDLHVWGEEAPVMAALIANGYSFKYETATSKTFSMSGITVQILKTQPENFDFTISKASYNLEYAALAIDKVSYDRRILVPNTFTDKKLVLNSLARIPHWMAKGFKMKNETYFSLLNCLNEKEILIHPGSAYKS